VGGYAAGKSEGEGESRQEKDQADARLSKDESRSHGRECSAGQGSTEIAWEATTPVDVPDSGREGLSR
jgi:hypothetical protein